MGGQGRDAEDVRSGGLAMLILACVAIGFVVGWAAWEAWQ